jgi:hypothetical protein
MLSECKKKEYFDCVKSKGKGLAAESLFLILILEQQKMINENDCGITTSGKSLFQKFLM